MKMPVQQIFERGLFAKKGILITGAAGGVGRATAQLLCSLGARLVLTDSNAGSLEIVVKDLVGAEVLGITADIRSAPECARVVDAALEHLGALDGLVNCAGVWVEGQSSAASEEDWSACIDVNLKGCFFMCARAIPALTAQRGSIVNVSSDAGVVGNAGAAIYCASKGGVTLMSKALALELAPIGIRVNALCPADIMSPMLQGQALRFGKGDPEAYYQKLLANYPQQENARFIRPEEVASQIAFLLSPAAAAVTGASVMLDFGLTAGY